MDNSKLIRKRCFYAISFYALVLSCAFAALVYYGVNRFLAGFSTEGGQQVLIQNIPVWIALVEQALANFYYGVIAGISLLIFLFSWSFWLILTWAIPSGLKHRLKEEDPSGKQKPGKKDFIDHRIEQERKIRLFLHSLTILQREGRLLDFFDEDLNGYDDEQIGAAVRSIQADCKQAMKKYIDPKPVINSEEGDPITIDSGFDMDAIHLVGNVAGEPPFRGRLKHRGWKAGKKEIPKLSDVQDATIIIPAEVEI